jgi:hypothetical protein
VGVESSEDMFLMCVVEEAGEAFEGMSVDNVGDVVVIVKESIVDGRKVVTKEAKLFGVSCLPWFERRGEGERKLNGG